MAPRDPSSFRQQGAAAGATGAVHRPRLRRGAGLPLRVLRRDRLADRQAGDPVRRAAALCAAALLGTSLGLACGYSPTEPFALVSMPCAIGDTSAPPVRAVLVLRLDAGGDCWHEEAR